jgi:ATP-dependent RNA helicase RhlE
MLADPAMSSVLVFARTKHGADRVVRDLERDGFEAAVIHGYKSQNARQKALNGFRDGSVRILVATDIAARGIDVPGISHVVNFDLPDEAESYVHRIGRTGRNGAAGVAITLCDPAEASKLKAVERVIRKRLTVVADHTREPDPQPAPRDSHTVRHADRDWVGQGGQPRTERGAQPHHHANGSNKQAHQHANGSGKPAHHHRKDDGKPAQHHRKDGGKAAPHHAAGGKPGQGDQRNARPDGQRKPFRGKRRFGGKRFAQRAA